MRATTFRIHHPLESISLAVAGLVLFLGMLLASAASTAQEMRFPEIELEDLTGRDLSLPKDLPGNPTLVLMAFTREQQVEIDEWVASLALKERGDLEWVELPVLGRGARIAKGFINKGMRKGIPDESMHARTLTYYGKIKNVLKPLGLPNKDQIYLALTDQSGAVWLLLSGPYTVEKEEQLRQALLNIPVSG